MAAAVADRSSSAQGLRCALASAQQAISAACQPALHHLQAAVSVLGAEGPEGEPQVHALASMLQGVSGLLRDLPPAEADLAGCVGALSSAVAQMAAGYATVSSMTQEREKVCGALHVCSSGWSVVSNTTACGFLQLPPQIAFLAVAIATMKQQPAENEEFCRSVSDNVLKPPSSHLLTMQVHQVLSSVNSQLQAAATSHPSRSQAAGLSAAAGSALVGGSAAAAVGSASLSLVDLLQQLTQTVVGMVEGLAVEKECLESKMLHAADESTQLRSQVLTALLLV